MGDTDLKLKIGIPGGAGYIGSTLVGDLLRLGYEVRVWDNFKFQQASLNQFCINPSFSVVNIDATDPKAVREIVAFSDVIIPLCAIVGAPACDREAFTAQELNVGFIDRLASACSRDQSIIYPVTNSGYGIGEKDSYCTEESPLRPLSLYGKTKVRAEEIILDSGFGPTFRLATVFGSSPRMRTDLLVNDFVLRALKDRALILFEHEFRRNFIHVRDVSLAFQFGLENIEVMRGECFNVGLSDANLTKLELANRIKKYIPELQVILHSINSDPDKRDYFVSNEKIEGLGWKPEVTLDDGIVELIKLFSYMPFCQYRNTF